ncbi:MAG TPA: hypothetical protein VID49_12705, partial [Steroidobacteraceae bacterium]
MSSSHYDRSKLLQGNPVPSFANLKPPHYAHSADRSTRNNRAPMLLECVGNTCSSPDMAAPKSCRS